MGRGGSDARPFKLSDSDSIATLASLASQLARVVAYPSEHGGEGHGLPQHLPRLGPRPTRHLHHESAGVDVEGTRGHALGRFFLDAASLEFVEPILVHEASPSEEGAAELRVAELGRSRGLLAERLQSGQDLLRQSREVGDPHTGRVLDGVDDGHVG